MATRNSTGAKRAKSPMAKRKSARGLLDERRRLAVFWSHWQVEPVRPYDGDAVSSWEEFAEVTGLDVDEITVDEDVVARARQILWGGEFEFSESQQAELRRLLLKRGGAPWISSL